APTHRLFVDRCPRAHAPFAVSGEGQFQEISQKSAQWKTTDFTDQTDRRSRRSGAFSATDQQLSLVSYNLSGRGHSEGHDDGPTLAQRMGALAADNKRGA